MSVNYRLVLRECKRRRASELDFSHQEITIVPEEVFSLTFLKRLDLSGNQIATLDKRFEQLSELEHLDLSDNKFSDFPSILLSLPKLKTVKVSGNQFSDHFAFLGSVSDQFDSWKNRVQEIHDRSARCFKDDFFSDDEDHKPQSWLPSLNSKISCSDEKASSITKETNHSEDKETISRLRKQIKSLQDEKQGMEKEFLQTKRNGFDVVKRNSCTELQIRSMAEITEMEKIAQGGFSIIEKACFRGTTVVLKKFFDPTNSPETKEEFLNEAKIF